LGVPQTSKIVPGDFVRRLRRAAGLDPGINLIFLELPKTTHAMGGHGMLVNPAVNGITADTEVLAYLVYRQMASL